MHSIQYILTFALAALVLMIAKVKLSLKAKQVGFSVWIELRVFVFFGLLGWPFRFVLRVDTEKLNTDPLAIKNAVSLFRLTRSGRMKALKRKNNTKDKPKLPAFPLLNALDLEKLWIGGEIALDDASLCVIICGALNSAFEPALRLGMNLFPIDARKAKIKAVFLPKFTETKLRLNFDGIVKTNMVKLIKGLICALAQRRSKRIKNKFKTKKGENSCIPLKT